MTARDTHPGSYDTFTAPAAWGEVVTPSDVNDLTRVSRAIWVGGGGDINVILEGQGDTVLIKSVPSGTLLPVAASRVKATSTTATNLVALS